MTLKMAEVWKAVLQFATLFFHFLLVFGATRPAAKTVGQPWPMPQVYTPSTTVQVLDRYYFQFTVSGSTCDILQEAIDRYFHIIFNEVSDTSLKFESARQKAKRTDGNLESLDVKVTAPCEKYPSLEMDESYDLTVGAGQAQLTSKSIWGALRGLETFSQLVYEDFYGSYRVNNTKIHDFPRFSHRGVLLDTSRHYIRKEVLLQNLEAMAYNKMNVFHWHITDEESFPYQSMAYPEMSNKGAYSPYDHIYSQEDLKEILEFARLRGIRVVPEFDTPGHSLSWGLGQPDLLTPCYTDGKPDGTYGPINPIVNSTYGFLSGLMMELTEVFPDKYLHLGGDEVSFSCWKSNPDITQFMQDQGFGTDYSKLEQYYMQRLLDIVSSYNTGYIIWQEVVDNGVKVRPDTVVHVWKDHYQQELLKVTSLGLRTLLSSPWYLDYISIDTRWKSYYNVDMLDFNGTESQNKLVMGGEACLWGEYVDSTNLEARLWPRASAVAERLWSAGSVNSVTEAAPRLEEHRCRMVMRGISAEPPNGPGFCRHEFVSKRHNYWKTKSP